MSDLRWRLRLKSGIAAMVDIAAWFMILIGFASIIGWYFDIYGLNGVWLPGFYAVNPIVALCLLAYGAMIATGAFHKENCSRKHYLTVLVGLIMLFCLLCLFAFMDGQGDLVGIFEGRKPEPDSSLGVFSMSVLASLIFFIGGALLILKLYFQKNQLVLQILSGFGVITAFIGFLGSLGYLFSTPLLYEAKIIQLSINNSVGFMWFGTALYCMSGSNTFFTRHFFGTSSSAIVLRVFLPLVIGGILFEAVLFDYLTSNSQESTAMTMAILTVFSVILTTVVLVLVSKFVFKRADQAEAGRKKSQEIIHRERILMRTLIDNLPDTIYVKDMHARKVLANLADVEATGRKTEAEILGKTDKEIFNEVDGAHGYEQDMLVIKSGKPLINHEKEYVDKLGRIRWLSTSKIPLRDTNDQIVGLVGIGHDITAKKAHEEQMILMTHAMQSLNDCVSITDTADKIIYVNDAFIRTYGYSREELIGENIKIVRKKGDEDEKTQTILPSTIHSGWHGEIVNCKKDGTAFEVEISTSPVRNEAGEIIALSGIAVDISERKRMEKALESSKERYRTLIENQGEGVGLVDVDEVVTFANPAAEQIFGVQPGELLGKNLMEFVTPESMELIRQQTAKRAKNEKSSYEIEILGGDRVKRMILVTATPQFNEDGKHTGAFGIFRDITLQKEAEAARRKSEEKYRVLVESIPDGVYKRGANGRFIEINPALMQMLGFADKESVYQVDAINRFFPSRNERKLVFSNDKAEEICEYQITTKDNKLIWVEDHSHKAIDEESGVEYFEGIMRDITSRKLADEELIRQKNFLETIIESLNYPFYVVNVDDYTIRLANSAAKKHFIKGKQTCYGLTHGIDMPCINMGEKCPLHICVETKQSVILEHIHQEPNGDMQVADVHVYPIFDQKGDVTQIIEYSLDITERKKIELQLARQSEELRELNTTKDKFFSIIAHDLRSPFNAILGLSGMLTADFDDYDRKSIHETVLEIDQASKKAFTLLENLLEWARSQTGKIEYRPVAFDLVELIDLTVSSAQTPANNKQIELSADVPKFMSVVADKNMVYTILRNLISNAIKFTPEHGKVTVKAKKSDSEVLISVSDTGVGISNENLSKLFKIDKTFTSPGTNNEKGTGLGLVLCKEFVEKHHGNIWVDSVLHDAEKGITGGSTFNFSIPVGIQPIS
ncbi:MAG: PAS domain S-box protein [Bacteroidales bacterium]|nr:PAS domain S-box protein [Bacteroidales bacterium]